MSKCRLGVFIPLPALSRSPRRGIPAIFEENEHVFPYQTRHFRHFRRCQAGRETRRRQAGRQAVGAREEEVISEAAAALTAA
tara:strand:- start:238 stop:483 length:246 start_codon:yes stop_codon:yes gene_type:complete